MTLVLLTQHNASSFSCSISFLYLFTLFLRHFHICHFQSIAKIVIDCTTLQINYCLIVKRDQGYLKSLNFIWSLQTWVLEEVSSIVHTHTHTHTHTFYCFANSVKPHLWFSHRHKSAHTGRYRNSCLSIWDGRRVCSLSCNPFCCWGVCLVCSWVAILIPICCIFVGVCLGDSEVPVRGVNMCVY